MVIKITPYISYSMLILSSPIHLVCGCVNVLLVQYTCTHVHMWSADKLNVYWLISVLLVEETTQSLPDHCA